MLSTSSQTRDPFPWASGPWAIPAQWWEVWTPPPRLTVAEWADRERVLSPEASAEPGRWKTERAEYLRGILEAFSDPTVESVVVQSSAQVGKTEVLNNVAGYFIDQDPAPIQVVYPTLEMATAWSKDRLAPMLRDTPALRDRVGEARARTAESRILHKRFPGGHLTASGANAPASLAARPIRVVLCDEVDRFPKSAGAEGDPVALVRKRTTTFWNRKLGLFSTPTIRGESRIEAAYLESDQRVYRVPCPACGHRQVMRWAQVRWQPGAPESALYYCEADGCGAAWNDAQRWRAVRAGEWQARAPFRGVAGFHLSELLSPWVKLAEMAVGFLAARPYRDRLRAWINTSLGETWEEEGSEIDADALRSRREAYAAEVPAPVVLLTAAVDVQDDRLELEVVGWGVDESTWGIWHQAFPGSPATAAPWDAALDVLRRKWRHESGVELTIAAAAVDTHGHHTLEAYRFCKANRHRRFFAIRGTAGPGKQPIGRPSKSNAARVALYTVAVDVFKERLFARLELEPRPQADADAAPVYPPGYCHFPEAYDDEFFNQLTAEQIRTRYVRGFPRREFVKTRPRNEALDLRVYNLVAFAILKPDLPALAARLARRVAELGKRRPAPAQETPEAARDRAAELAVEVLEELENDLDAAAETRAAAAAARARLEERRRERAVLAAIGRGGAGKRRPRGGYVKGWRR